MGLVLCRWTRTARPPRDARKNLGSRARTTRMHSSLYMRSSWVPEPSQVDVEAIVAGPVTKRRAHGLRPAPHYVVKWQDWDWADWCSCSWRPRPHSAGAGECIGQACFASR